MNKNCITDPTASNCTRFLWSTTNPTNTISYACKNFPNIVDINSPTYINCYNKITGANLKPPTNSKYSPYECMNFFGGHSPDGGSLPWGVNTVGECNGADQICSNNDPDWPNCLYRNAVGVSNAEEKFVDTCVNIAPNDPWTDGTISDICKDNYSMNLLCCHNIGYGGITNGLCFYAPGSWKICDTSYSNLKNSNTVATPITGSKGKNCCPANRQPPCGDFCCDPVKETCGRAKVNSLHDIGPWVCKPKKDTCTAPNTVYCPAKDMSQCCPTNNGCGKILQSRMGISVEVAVCVPPGSCTSGTECGTTIEGKKICCPANQECGVTDGGDKMPRCQPKPNNCPDTNYPDFCSGKSGLAGGTITMCCKAGKCGHHPDGAPYCDD
ncbi:MAG: hypothetical protein WCP18_02390 [bacterium]